MSNYAQQLQFFLLDDLDSDRERRDGGDDMQQRAQARLSKDLASMVHALPGGLLGYISDNKDRIYDLFVG